MTDRWMRSPRGIIFGIVTGLAEWRDLPPSTTRTIVLFLILFTGIFPGVVVYLLLALVLPPQLEDSCEEKKNSSRFDHIYRNADDVEYEKERGKSTEALKAEYEELKKKVEAMENEMFDKEREWDDKFNRGK